MASLNESAHKKSLPIAGGRGSIICTVNWSETADDFRIFCGEPKRLEKNTTSRLASLGIMGQLRGPLKTMNTTQKKIIRYLKIPPTLIPSIPQCRDVGGVSARPQLRPHDVSRDASLSDSFDVFFSSFANHRHIFNIYMYQQRSAFLFRVIFNQIQLY